MITLISQGRTVDHTTLWNHRGKDWVNGKVYVCLLEVDFTIYLNSVCVCVQKKKGSAKKEGVKQRKEKGKKRQEEKGSKASLLKWKRGSEFRKQRPARKDLAIKQQRPLLIKQQRLLLNKRWQMAQSPSFQTERNWWQGPLGRYALYRSGRGHKISSRQHLDIQVTAQWHTADGQRKENYLL